jgi:antitoxin (DNA-binding transcriptional repressor) of toxin-antitoxin stability system
MKHDRIEQGVEGELVITATEFKAKCLDILDRLNSGELRRVTVTKRGKRMGEMTAASAAPRSYERAPIFGRMKGTFSLPPDLDLTQPIFDGEIEAETGPWER